MKIRLDLLDQDEWLEDDRRSHLDRRKKNKLPKFQLNKDVQEGARDRRRTQDRRLGGVNFSDFMDEGESLLKR